MSKFYGVVRVTYQNLTKKYSFGVQAVQTGILLSTGDLIAQKFVEKKKNSEINFTRMSKFFILGLGLVGPALTTWYRFLSKTVTAGTNRTVVLKKVALDQFVFAPFSTFAFISSLNVLEGNNWEFIKQELRHKYGDILITGYTVWPFVQIVNFYTVPLKHQVLVVQIVALFWNTYFCWKTHQKLDY